MTIKLVGQDDGSSAGVSPANYIIGNRHAAVASGNVIEIRFRVVASVAGNVIVGLYSDNAGAPNALLGSKVVAVSSAAARVVTATLDSAIAVTSGTYYWVFFNSSANLVSYGASTGSVRKYKTGAYGALPDPAGTGYTDDTYIIFDAGWGTKIITDILSLVDSRTNKTLKPLTDSTTLVDTVEKIFKKIVDSAITLAEDFSKVYTAISGDTYKVIEDVISITDTRLNNLMIIAGIDSILLVDNTRRFLAKSLLSAITLIDSISRLAQYWRTISSSISLVPTLITKADFFIQILEVISLVDSYVRNSTIFRVISDVVEIVDSTVRSIRKTLLSVVTVVDSVAKALANIVSDVIVIVDGVGNVLRRILNDTVTLVGSFYKVIYKALTSTVVIDSILTASYGYRIAIVDYIILVPTLITQTSLYIQILEVVRLADAMSKATNRNIIDTISLIESMGRRIYKVLTSVISLVVSILSRYLPIGEVIMYLSCYQRVDMYLTVEGGGLGS